MTAWRAGARQDYLRRRAWRLGVPLLVSIFVLIPIAYYASFLRYHLPGTTDFNFFHYWWHMITIGPWPSGQSWFLWVLLALRRRRGRDLDDGAENPQRPSAG